MKPLYHMALNDWDKSGHRSLEFVPLKSIDIVSVGHVGQMGHFL